MKLRNVLTIIFVIVCTATVASSALAQGTQPAKATDGQAQSTIEPLSKKRLLKLLTLNDSTQQELIQIIGQKGVDFQPTPADERELHDAGATDDLIVAVRSNYHGGASQSNAQVNQQQNTSADTNGQAAQSPANSSNGSAQAPKKKGFLSKVNDKLNKVNSTLAQQAGTTQPPATDQPTTTTPQPVAPAGPANIVAPDPQTTVAQSAPAQPGQKKGFLSKLNNGLNKANDKLTKVAATLNPVVAQTGAPNQPTPDTTQTTTIAPANRNATPAPATTQVAQAPAGDATSGSAPATLAGTYWNMTSMTTKGETEKKSGAPGPDVEFCRDGKWGMLHYGGAREAGTYQQQGGRLLMKMEDGSLFGNFQINRNGNEMTLDDGKYVLRLKYQHAAGC